VTLGIALISEVSVLAKTINRGDIWLVNFDPTAGREQKGTRPAVVVSSNEMDSSIIELAFVMPGTTRNRSLPNHITVHPSAVNKLKETTYFMAEQLRSVSIDRFEQQLGILSDKELFDIEEVLILLLDLGPK
jgi:mRNA interferase MazF